MSRRRRAGSEDNAPIVTFPPVAVQTTVKEPVGATTTGVQLPVVTTEPSSTQLPSPILYCNQTLVRSARPLAVRGPRSLGPATTVVCDASVPDTRRHVTLCAVPLLRFDATT